MKKILLAEVAVLLVLVLVAVFVRIGGSRQPEVIQNATQQTTAPAVSDPTQQVTDVFSPETEPPTEAPTPAPTEPPTEPPTEQPTQTPTLPVVPEEPGIPVSFSLNAKHYFVYDLERGEYLAISGNEDTPIYPASITKLFSAWVALQYLDPEEIITAGEELDLVKKGSSLAYIYKGNQLTVDMLVEGMMLPSGNDAAYILAAATSRAVTGNPDMPAEEAIAHFVNLMNFTADMMGLTGSNFCNPDGFHDPGHYTSFHDLTIIARLALENEVISHYAAKQKDSKVVYESGEIISWKNSNALLNPDSGYYTKNAIGLKTGTTGEAGNCLLSAFKEKDGVYIIGVFGCEESNDRYKDTRKLYKNIVCD